MDSANTIPIQQFHGFASKALECGDLDDYLSALLLPQTLQTFKYIPFSIPKSDIKKILSFVTFALSVKSVECTPACRALGLRLRNTRRSTSMSLLVYAILKLLIPQIRRLIEEKLIKYRTTSTTGENLSSSEALAQERQHQTLTFFQKVIPMLRLLLLLNCWRNARNSSSIIPDLEKWVSGFRYESAAPPLMPLMPKGESIHVLFAHRRWIQRWLQVCVPILALPLLRSASESRELLVSWKEELQRCILNPMWKFVSFNGDRSSVKSQCPICQTQNEITIPVEAGCGHVYCYTCLWTYLREQDRQRCKVCSQSITSCRPVRKKLENTLY